MDATKEKTSLVDIDIETTCEHDDGCENLATVGYLFHASGKLGRCYCDQHIPPTATERTNLHLPLAYKRAIPDGETLAEFVREAMRREFRRRKIAVAVIDVQRGRPSGE